MGVPLVASSFLLATAGRAVRFNLFCFLHLAHAQGKKTKKDFHCHPSRKGSTQKNDGF
jgi:hypothetical protein